MGVQTPHWIFNLYFNCVCTKILSKLCSCIYEIQKFCAGKRKKLYSIFTFCFSLLALPLDGLTSARMTVYCTHRWNNKQNCVSAPVVTWSIQKSQSCMLSAFPQWSLPAWRRGNSAHRRTWPVAQLHRPNHSSEFRIGSCQYQKTWLYQKQMSINFFHTSSALTTIILVHVNKWPDRTHKMAS